MTRQPCDRFTCGADEQLCDDCLRLWLNRKPPPPHFVFNDEPARPWVGTWRDWFDAEGNYLGNRGGAVDSEGA